MNNELSDKIFNDFPEFFKHKDNMRASLMMFGFECGDGWFNLIYDLCRDIKDWFLNNESSHVVDDDLNVVVRKGVPPHFQVQQVKEKFGGLRFYIGGAPRVIHDMIRDAEFRSYFICEHCGKECVQDGNGYKSFYRDGLSWVLTLCDGCLDKHIFRKYGRKRKDGEDFISDWQREHSAPFVEVEV